jgi:hypothetical protein
MKKMRFYLGAALLSIAGSSFFITGCEKDQTPAPASQLSTQRGPNTVNVQSGNGTPVHKAFVAEFNQGGGCSSGPIVMHNGDLWNFDPTPGHHRPVQSGLIAGPLRAPTRPVAHFTWQKAMPIRMALPNCTR